MRFAVKRCTHRALRRLIHSELLNFRATVRTREPGRGAADQSRDPSVCAHSSAVGRRHVCDCLRIPTDHDSTVRGLALSESRAPAAAPTGRATTTRRATTAMDARERTRRRGTRARCDATTGRGRARWRRRRAATRGTAGSGRRDARATREREGRGRVEGRGTRRREDGR